MFALAALEGWCTAALNPEGFELKGKEYKVMRLRKALYGLKQAANSWWKVLLKSIKELGFQRLQSDARVFVYKHHNGLIVIVMVFYM
ncbi:hypothetical protein AX16_001268 [Volvariella volvacea WC 439]|nr:hypothetical protein AX16_001268 [Volvariella volvacea WC 439]